MNRKDLSLAAIIGLAVGLLVQPIIANVIPALTLPLRAAVFLGFVVLAPVALALAAWLSKFLPVLYQFAKFAAVGSLNSFLDLGLFNLETFLYGSVPGGSLYPIFKSISFLIATSNSFLWNKFWTFGSSTKANSTEVLKFYGITLIGWMVNVGVATFVKNAAVSAGLSVSLWGNVAAPVVGIFAALFWNFFGYKFVVFKKSA